MPCLRKVPLRLLMQGIKRVYADVLYIMVPFFFRFGEDA